MIAKRVHFSEKVFVKSCEDNLSLKVATVSSEGGKYCTCLHVFGAYVYAHTQTHNILHM